MTNIHAKQGLQTVGGFGVRRPRAGRGPDGGDSRQNRQCQRLSFKEGPRRPPEVPAGLLHVW